MKNKKVLSKKGFMLVETLIATVFVASIFSLLCMNLFPLVGDYERIRNYNTVESIYMAHWARVNALNGLPNDSYDTVKDLGYLDITDCSLYSNEDFSMDCAAFKTINNVSKIYLTSYSTEKLKEEVRDNNSYSRRFRDYISYLPTYSKNTSKTPSSGYYRVIIEYTSNDSYKYGTIELYKK